MPAVVPHGSPVVPEVAPIPPKMAPAPIRVAPVVAKRAPVIAQLVSGVGEVAPILTNAARCARGLGRRCGGRLAVGHGRGGESQRRGEGEAVDGQHEISPCLELVRRRWSAR